MLQVMGAAECSRDLGLRHGDGLGGNRGDESLVGVVELEPLIFASHVVDDGHSTSCWYEPRVQAVLATAWSCALRTATHVRTHPSLRENPWQTHDDRWSSLASAVHVGSIMNRSTRLAFRAGAWTSSMH